MKERIVGLPSSAPNISIAATLEFPDNGPTHVVLLLPVAGPTDRDMSLGSRGIYAEVAAQLAGANIASLRVADRGVDGSEGDWLATDFDTRLADARTALHWMREHPELEGARLGAVGISEGGALALSLAAEGELDFAVALSTPMEDGVTTLRAQRDRLLDASQLLPEHRTNMRSESDRFLAALLSDDEATVREILGGPAGHLILPPYGFVPGDPTGRIRFALSPWYRSQVRYDIGATLSAIGVPVYAAYGSLDQVIDASRSVALLRQRLGHEARIELIDGLNHLMMPAVTGSPLEYGQLPEVTSAELWSAIATWIRAR